VVVNAVTGADDETLRTHRAPGETDARREVIAIRQVSGLGDTAGPRHDEFASRLRRAGGGSRAEVGHAQLVLPLSDRQVVFVTHAEVQREPGGYPEVVLQIGPERR